MIAYAKEDVRLVSEGRFSMAIAAGNNGGDNIDQLPAFEANNDDWLYTP